MVVCMTSGEGIKATVYGYRMLLSCSNSLRKQGCGVACSGKDWIFARFSSK